ncbi:28S ribosomal protein S31, mitochondrial [Ixodes scapularis]
MLGVLRCTQRARCAYKALPRHCSSSSKTPDEPDQTVKEPDQAKKAAMDKLSALLTDMKIESVSSSDPSSISFKLAKPGRPKKPELREAAAKTKGLEQQMVEAVKEVAASLGGDQEQTESELLSKLRLHKEEKDAGGDLADDKSKAHLGDLFVGMKVDRRSGRKSGQRPTGMTRRGVAEDGAAFGTPVLPGTIDALAQAVGRDERGSRKRVIPTEGSEEKMDLGSGVRLNIFSNERQEKDAPRLETWERLQQRELRLLATPPPRNAYEEMILWTEQGKLWTFPINNEAGLEEEAKVPFTDHVFLEDLIEDFPRTGPVRHFMELVLVGLSKNPYISVQRKREHIDWFRQYFREKHEVLRLAGALPGEGPTPPPLAAPGDEGAAQSTAAHN